MQRKKSVALGYLGWMMGGMHYIYVGSWIKQLFFWGTLGGLLMWWMLDVFLMFMIVAKANQKIAFTLIQELYEEEYQKSGAATGDESSPHAQV